MQSNIIYEKRKLWSSGRDLALDWKVMGLIPIQCSMEVVSKPCQDRFMHPILVYYRKIR